MIQILFILWLALLGQPSFAESLPQISQRINAAEQLVLGLKERNQAHIDFADPAHPGRTPVVFLYLHGFSASPRELSPLTEDLAHEWHSNAYFPRYKGHGIQGADGLKDIKLEDWETETRAAIGTAHELGDKVVIISASTGSSLAIPALLEDSREIAAIVMVSPNFRLHRLDSELLRLPFGAWIARMIVGEYREWKARNAEHEYFWTTRYPSAVVRLPVLAAAKARNATLEALKVPVLMAYSPGDTVVNIPSTLTAFERWGAEKKELALVPEAEDPHTIAGNIVSPKGEAVLIKQVRAFLKSLPL